MPDRATTAAPGAQRREGTGHTLLVALLVSLVCSVFVAAAAVLLEPRQKLNRELDRQRNILAVAGLLDPQQDIASSFANIEARVVDLASGRYSDALPPDFDVRSAASDTELGVDVPPEKDIARIGRRARYATVYLAREGPDLRYIVLPVYGQGLWGAIHGFLALEADVNTIAGITFYQHAETPGLGGEIDNPRWRAAWRGRLAFDENGDPAIAVARGKVVDSGDWTGATAAVAAHRVDGLAGATLTGKAVTNLVQFWLGNEGFGPFLQRVWEKGS